MTSSICSGHFHSRTGQADLIPEFGTRHAHAQYVLRPSAYAVIRDPARGIPVVRTPRGLYLPGGGQHAGETLEQTVTREVAEECGLQVALEEQLGTADQYVYAAEEATHFIKRSTFFRARIVGAAAASEPGHALHWLEPGDVLAHDSHRWAVALVTQAR